MDLDLFRGVVPFVAVVEEKTFRQAAARLGVSPAAVSKAVAALEEELGVTLLVRGPRSVSLTREGELFFEQCRPATYGVMAARRQVDGARREPQGELAVSVPFVVAKLLPPALAMLRTRFPRLSFRIEVSDLLTKLGEAPIDIAVRVGPLAGASLVARKLCTTRMIVVASPSYLARAGEPSTPADLASHDTVVWMAPHGKSHPWLFTSGPVEVRPRLIFDHAPSLLDAALAGLGVVQLFDFMAEEHLRSGRLVQLLASESAEGPPVHAVCSPDRRATPKVRAAFEAFADSFGARR